MDLNTATFEEMQSLAGIGHGRAQAIFDGRASLNRPLTLLDLLEMGIPADVVKALVDDLEIKAIPRHEEKDEGIDVQQMVVAALASLQRISSDVNGLSVAIDNVNMRQAHFESILNAGGRISGPKVECGELNTKPMAIAANKMSDAGSQTDILGDGEGRLSGTKLEHTASDLFNSPMVQNVGLMDLVESPRRVEIPSQSETKTVVSCSCSNSVRSRCTPAQGAVSPSRTVVGDMRQEEGSTSSRADRYRWAKIRIPEFRGGDKWSSYLVQFRTIMKMHGCYDNDVMVFKLVEALRGPALEYYNSLPAETRGQLSTLCTLFEGRFGRQEPPATTRSNLKTIIQRVDEPLPEFAERTLRMAADGYSGMGGEWIQVLAVDAFLMGCTDKRSARSALDRDPKTVDEAVSLMRRFHGHEKALSIERRVRTLALEEEDPVVPQVNRVQEERSGSLDVGELNENIEKLTKLLANLNMAGQGRRMGPVKCFACGETGHIARYCRSNVQRPYPRPRDGAYVKAAQEKTH